MAVKRVAQPVEKGGVPRFVARQRIVEQAADRSCALGREVGQVHGGEFPANVGGRIGGEIMDPFHHRVAGEDEFCVADRQDRDVVHQPLRGGMVGQQAQQGEEAGFGGHGRSLAF